MFIERVLVTAVGRFSDALIVHWPIDPTKGQWLCCWSLRTLLVPQCSCNLPLESLLCELEGGLAHCSLGLAPLWVHA